MIDALVAGLRVNACTVWGPMNAAAALATVVERAALHQVVACNRDVPLDGVAAALAAAEIEVLTPSDARWSERLPDAGAGITGARLAVAVPAAVAVAAAPGSPRATSLVPGTHVCVVRATDVLPTFAEAMSVVAAGELPSTLTWIGGPSRTGDLEMVTTLGVHGPRAVDVVLLS